MQNEYPSTTLPLMEGCASAVIWTFEAVEERLVAALIVARRVPDREASWLRVKACWPDVVRATWLGDTYLGDYGGEGVDGVSAAHVRRPQLGREEIAAMVEAERWLGRYLDEDARVLVGLALGWLSRGRRIGWKRIGRIMGVSVTPTTLRQRYMLAIARIACGLNGHGDAAARDVLRRQLLSEARRAAGDAPAVRGRKARRRPVVVDVVYCER